MNTNKGLTVILLLFFISGLFTPVFNSVSASALFEDTWTKMPAMDQPRYDFEVVVVEGKIYAIGGCYAYEYLSSNERYDPKTDKWTTLASMPTSRGKFIIVTCQGSIYCMGGTTNDGPVNESGPILFRPVNVVEVYDPATNSWSSKEPLPFYINDDVYYSEYIFQDILPVQVVNGQIFVIASDRVLYVYNPLTDKWSNKAPLPVKEEPVRTHVINEQLYVITQSALYMYNPVTDTWTNKTEMPSSRTYAFSAVMDNKMIVGDYLITTGITNWGSIFSAQLRVRSYNPVTDVWYNGKITDEHIFSNGVTPIIITGDYAPKSIYVLGLESSKEDIYNMKPFTWVYDPIDDIWSTAKTPDAAPYNWLGIRTITVDDVFYVIDCFKYTPINYSPQGYHDNRPFATASPTDSTSTNPYEPERAGYSLTFYIVITTVLAICVIATLFFYIAKKQKNESIKDEYE